MDDDKTNAKIDGDAELFTALISAQYEIGIAAKDGRNEHGNYKYTSADGMRHHCKEALGSNGLAFILGTYRIKWDDGQSKGAKGEQSGTLLLNYELIHTSGSRRVFPMEMPFLVRKNAPDKSIAAALSFSNTYALQSLLQVSRGDDIEQVDQREDHEVRRPNQQRSQQRSQRSQQRSQQQPTGNPEALDPGKMSAEIENARKTALAELATLRERWGADAITDAWSKHEHANHPTFDVRNPRVDPRRVQQVVKFVRDQLEGAEPTPEQLASKPETENQEPAATDDGNTSTENPTDAPIENPPTEKNAPIENPATKAKIEAECIRFCRRNQWDENYVGQVIKESLDTPRDELTIEMWESVLEVLKSDAKAASKKEE